jgi:hypothetical protein
MSLESMVMLAVSVLTAVSSMYDPGLRGLSKQELFPTSPPSAAIAVAWPQ